MIYSMRRSSPLKNSHEKQQNYEDEGAKLGYKDTTTLEQQQIFADQEETPISREKRAIVYQRAKGQLDTLPFGTKRDVDQVGYEWINHSLMAVAPAPDADERRIRIGGPRRPIGSSPKHDRVESDRQGGDEVEPRFGHTG